MITYHSGRRAASKWVVGAALMAAASIGATRPVSGQSPAVTLTTTREVCVGARQHVIDELDSLRALAPARIAVTDQARARDLMLHEMAARHCGTLEAMLVAIHRALAEPPLGDWPQRPLRLASGWRASLGRGECLRDEGPAALTVRLLGERG